jgi:hypothetical protein
MDDFPKEALEGRRIRSFALTGLCRIFISVQGLALLAIDRRPFGTRERFAN